MPEDIPYHPEETEPEERLKDPEMDFDTVIATLADGNPASIQVLKELMDIDPMMVLEVDSAHLYGGEIADVYKRACKSDINAFIKYLQERRQILREAREFEQGQA